MQRRNPVLPANLDRLPGDREARGFTPDWTAHGAFSLIELLMVAALIGIVMRLAVPAFHMLNRAQELTTAANGVAGMLERGRAYAMANNLYVYVGIAEVSADQSSSAAPQKVATATVGGRLAVAVVAAREGTRGYTILSNLPDPAWTSYNNGAGLTALGKVEVFENIHLMDVLGIPPAGPMARATVPNSSQLGQPACKSVTEFAWPLGAPLDATRCQYYFTKVIQFDPHGTARIQYSTNQDNIVPRMEIALQQTHGSAVPPVPPAGTGAVAAIVIDGMTGAVRIYRP